MLICRLIPAFRISDIPRIAPSKAPETPRNASCVFASAPSMLTLIRDIPALFSLSATSLVTGVPLVASTTRSPLSTPYLAISYTSPRISGSPPLRMSIGLAKSTISSIRRNASAVDNSSGSGVSVDDPRQCLHLRLQAPVSSHAIRRGFISFIMVPVMVCHRYHCHCLSLSDHLQHITDLVYRA